MLLKKKQSHNTVPIPPITTAKCSMASAILRSASICVIVNLCKYKHSYRPILSVIVPLLILRVSIRLSEHLVLLTLESCQPLVRRGRCLGVSYWQYQSRRFLALPFCVFLITRSLFPFLPATLINSHLPVLASCSPRLLAVFHPQSHCAINWQSVMSLDNCGGNTSKSAPISDIISSMVSSVI